MVSMRKKAESYIGKCVHLIRPAMVSGAFQTAFRYRRLPPIPLATKFLNLPDSINIITDTLTIAWEKIANADTYQIELLSADSQYNHDTSLTNTSLTLKNLKDGHVYSVKVRSKN
jgi:hypothetical protein